MDKKSPDRTERDDTDTSLRHEREKTDEELAKRRSTLEEDADEVVARARGRADEHLERARQRASSALDEAQPVAVQRQVTEEERRAEDVALARERTVEDAALANEREARKRALAELLRLERTDTDERLLVERDRSDEELRVRNDFMTMVSHDLRTLLGGIALQAALQLREVPDDETGRKLATRAKKIQHFTARMNRLIGDLVDVASIESGRFSVVPDKQDATALIRETLEAFQPLAAAQGIGLTAELDSDTLLARFDHDRILQVLANLVANAIKFTAAQGRIAIRVTASGTEVTFSISDDGTGIPTDELENIFQRFGQVTSGDRRGLGLGLFISKCIVEAHGGRIWAESTLGEGSTVSFTLPRG